MEEKIKIISLNENEPKETLYQYDKGQIIEFKEEIADETHVLISNAKSKKADRKVIVNNRVEVLDELLEESGTLVINVQIVDESSETTTKTIRMRVLPRKDAYGGPEKENQQTFLEQVQEIMTATKSIAENVQERADKGEFNGEKGEKGDKGDIGPQGEQGPQGEKGDAYIITDEDYEAIGEHVIDDTIVSASKTWSSDKINTEISKKQDLLVAGDYITIEDNVISANVQEAVETIGGVLSELETTDKSSFVGAINELNSDLDDVANVTTNYDYEENEEDVDNTSEITGTLIFTSGYLHVNTNVTESGRVIKCTVSKGEKYRVVCSYFNSIYAVGYGLTQSDDHTTDIYYFDSSATAWMDNQIFDVEVENDGYLYAYGRKNYNVSIKKLVSTRVYTSKSYDKETTDTKYVHSKPIFEKGAVLFSFDAMNLTDGRLDIMNEYGYRATAQTGNPTQTISQNKLDVIKGLRKAGWEIATYATLNFPVNTYGRDVACADEPTQEVIDAWDFYVSESIKGENAHGVFFPIVWNCRQGLFCTGLKMALEKYGYKMARGDYPIYAKRVECFGENYSFNVGSLGMYVDKVAETKARIDRAVNEKCGMVIFSHGLYSTDDDALANYGTTESVMREILDYVKSYVDQGKLDVLTYHELYSRYFPNNCYERDYMRTMASIGYLSD